MDEHYISPQELFRQLQGAQPPFVIDVRPDESYAAGHIPGAHHIHVDQLPQRLDEVPRDRPIVAY